MKNKYELLRNYCKDGDILDIGFAQTPNKYLKNPDGVDIFIPKIKPINYNKIIRCNLNKERIKQKNDSYENIILGDVIEHVESPTFLLRECNRLLKKKGRLIICTPQANDWWTTLHNWFFFNLIRDPDKDEHLSNWTFLDMRRLLNKNGFKLKKIYGYRMRTPFRKPFNKLFSVKYFPFLSWQVFYIAEKNMSPSNLITLKQNKKHIKVKNN
jgi:SAM-dependent methyltransferase